MSAFFFKDGFSVVCCLIFYSGLQLVLYMESTEYIPGVSNGYGARLTVSEPGTHPYPFDEGLDISSSMETSIGLKMVTLAT